MNRKQKKHRSSAQKVILSKKQIDKIKMDAYRDTLGRISDVLDPILKNTLVNSFRWFEGKHGENRIKRATKQMHKELDKIKMEVSR